MPTAATDDVHILASQIGSELAGAWLEITGTAYPGPPIDQDKDKQVLFLTISRGLLTYLATRNDLITSLDAKPAGGLDPNAQNISNIKFKLTDNPGGGVSKLPGDDVHILANQMQAEIAGAWDEIKGPPFPGNPADPNPLVLFLTISRGLLTYLAARNDLITSLDAAQIAGLATENISNIKYKLTDDTGGGVTNL